MEKVADPFFLTPFSDPIFPSLRKNSECYIFYVRINVFPYYMAKLSLNLHEIFNDGNAIDSNLNQILSEAIEKKIRLVEIIPGKGRKVLKKRVKRFLAQKHIRKLYHRLEVDDKNFGRLFVHFRF